MLIRKSILVEEVSMMDVITPKRIKITLKTLRAITFISLLLLVFLSTVILSIVLYAKWQGPPSLSVPQSTIIYANDGSKIGELHNGQKRYWVNLNDISQHVINATISIEDQSFYEHNGFDYKRIAGAALADLKAMAKVQEQVPLPSNMREIFLKHEKHGNEKQMRLFIRLGWSKIIVRIIY